MSADSKCKSFYKEKIMKKKIWILGIVMVVLFGLMMTGCDNGTTSEVKVIAEQYRGKFVHSGGASLILKESSIEGYTSSGEPNELTTASEAWTDGSDLWIKYVDNDIGNIGYFVGVNKLIYNTGTFTRSN
jgi:hypothetical protein